MAVKKTATKAAATKAPAKKPAAKATVKKTTPAKKPAQKVEEIAEEKPKLSLGKKIGIAAAGVGALVGAIILHGRSQYKSGSLDQATVDLDALANRPVDVTVNLLPGDNTNVESLDTGEDPVVDELTENDPIE